MEEIGIPKVLLQKVEKDKRAAISVRDIQRATDPEARIKAERELAVEYALGIHAKGRDVELGITSEESDALLGVVAGADYKEAARVDPFAEAKARKAQSEAIFEEEAQLWKSARR